MKIEVKVLNEKEFQMFFSKASEAIRKSADDTCGVAAEMAVEKAKRIVPVRTGTLQRSIFSIHPEFLKFIIGSRVHYAPYVEFGTSRMMARPFLRPAVLEVKSKIVKILEEKIEESLAELY